MAEPPGAPVTELTDGFAHADICKIRRDLKIFTTRCLFIVLRAGKFYHGGNAHTFTYAENVNYMDKGDLISTRATSSIWASASPTSCWATTWAVTSKRRPTAWLP